MRIIKKYISLLFYNYKPRLYGEIPKKIYFFWYDGFNNIPKLVRLNIDAWIKLNPEFEIVLIDKDDLSKIDLQLKIDYREIPIQAFSDILRAYLLTNNGGIWIDCTVFPVKPIKEWLPKNMTTEFFAFHCHHAKDCLLSSWFLASTKENIVMKNWYNEIKRYWNKPKQLLIDPRLGDAYPSNGYLEVSPIYSNDSNQFPYFWFHYLFTYLVHTSEEIAKIWEKVPNVSSTPLHELQNYLKTKDKFNKEEIWFIIKNKPMEKLDWRIDKSKIEQFANVLILENKI